MSEARRPDWDTPADGDFVRYVERLAAARAAPAAPSAQKDSPQVARSPGRRPEPAPAKVPSSSTNGVPPDLAEILKPLAGVLRAARGVLLALTALHAVALFVFGQGSLAVLAAMAAAWWGLGRIGDAPAHIARSSAAGRAASELQQRLRQAASPARATTPQKTKPS